jgi:hypothetical protein
MTQSLMDLMQVGGDPIDLMTGTITQLDMLYDTGTTDLLTDTTTPFPPDLL